MSTFVSMNGLFHVPLSSKRKTNQLNYLTSLRCLSSLSPTTHLQFWPLIKSSTSPLTVSQIILPKTDLSRVYNIILRELQDLPSSIRLNLFVSDFVIAPNMELREQTAQISAICSLVARKGNGGLCKFARLIPPPQLKLKVLKSKTSSLLSQTGFKFKTKYTSLLWP